MISLPESISSSSETVLLPSTRRTNPSALRRQPYSLSRHSLALICLSRAPILLLPGAGNVAGALILDISSVFRFLDRIFHILGSRGESRGESGALRGQFAPPDCCFLIAAMSNTLLRVHPSDLKMPFELKKHSSACLELFNKTDQWVAFKVKTTSPRKYSVRPTSGVVPPTGSRVITITMEAPKEIPPDYYCKDKFLVQSIAVQEGTMQKDIVPNIFSKAPGKLVEEFKLRVVYVPANPPSPVPEETEEEDGSLDSDVDHEVGGPSTSNSATGQGHTFRSQALHVEDDSPSKLELESRYAVENMKIQKELDLLRKTKASPGGFSSTFVLLVFFLSSILGYLMFGSKA